MFAHVCVCVEKSFDESLELIPCNWEIQAECKDKIINGRIKEREGNRIMESYRYKIEEKSI